VIVNVRKQGGVFVGEKDTLVTKCPSKFSAAKPKSQS
jgi:cytochrome c-type biogenesis protein CcmE